ncbi:MAG TPA: PQQ-binding-like beta-propeller repeat protein [Bryobacteraceae bacterium]|jgi:outer membrane protein assembly factor BamB
MFNLRHRIACAIIALPFLTLASDWTTFDGDPQRSGWAKDETEISKDNVKKLKLLWQVKLDNKSAGLGSLTAPITVSKVIHNSNFLDLAIVGGTSDKLFAIDIDAGKLFWQRQLPRPTTPKPNYASEWLCPFSLNATPIVDRPTKTLYTMASDGRLYFINWANGEDKEPPVEVLPPWAKTWSLNIADGFLYVPTSQRCGNVRSGIWAVDLKDAKHAVTSFLAGPTAGAGIWGRAGVTIGEDGFVYAETGDGPNDPETGKFADTILKLAPKTLKLSDYYIPANRAYLTRKDLDMGNMSPIVFPFQGKQLVAGAGKEGVIYLLDAASPGGADHRTPLFRSPLYTNDTAKFAGAGFWGSFATWQDKQGARWLLAPAWGPQGKESPKFPTSYDETPHGSIMAFKVEMKDGSPVLVPGWRSRDLSYPDPPIVANGIVFAVSTGDQVEQADANGKLYTVEDRVKLKTGNSVLYAFDAETGKELYSSGDTMKQFTHFSGLAIADGRLFCTTYDGVIYAFGLQ